MATFAKIKTRIYLVVKMKDRSKDSMFQDMKQLKKSLLENIFSNFISDNGDEFACYSIVEKDIEIDFYPKKTDLSLVKITI